MLNMLHVDQEKSKAKSIAQAKATAARYAATKESRIAIRKALIMHEVNKAPVHKRYIANY